MQPLDALAYGEHPVVLAQDAIHHLLGVRSLRAMSPLFSPFLAPPRDRLARGAFRSLCEFEERGAVELSVSVVFRLHIQI